MPENVAPRIAWQRTVISRRDASPLVDDHHLANVIFARGGAAHVGQHALDDDQLRTCDVCIPVLSKAYLASEHCRMEVFVARSPGKRIVPVMLEDCFDELRQHEETKGLEDLFMILLFKLRAVGLPITEEEAFRRLAAGIKSKDVALRHARRRLTKIRGFCMTDDVARGHPGPRLCHLYPNQRLAFVTQGRSRMR